MKSLISSLFCFAIGAVLLIGSAFADEENLKQETGTESLPLEQSEDTVEEDRGVFVDNFPLPDDEDEIFLESDQKATNALFYSFYTTHLGAYHHINAISMLGDTIEIEDGSIWSIHSWDSHKTKEWKKGHTVFITKNGWWGSCKYRLHNQNTKNSIRVDMSLQPLFNGVNTHWITDIDLDIRLVWLEDGSIWKIDRSEMQMLKTWKINHTVIIGINNNWFAGSYSNTLINVDKLDHNKKPHFIVGKCIN